MDYQGVGMELVGDVGRVVVISRDRMLIMSWFEPLAGIISDHEGERDSSAGRPRALTVCWGHEPLVGCRGPQSPAMRVELCPARRRRSAWLIDEDVRSSRGWLCS